MKNVIRIKKISKNKKGVSMVALIVTIIVIIILATIAILNLSGTIDQAGFSKFIQELSEVQQKNDQVRIENAIKGYGKENDGYQKIFVKNEPEYYKSFDKDFVTGYHISLERLGLNDMKTGKGKIKDGTVTFDKDDVYIYDANGIVYYVKGWLNLEGEKVYALEEGQIEIEKGPAISLIEYRLSEDKKKAIVKVIAEPVVGGELTVIIGDNVATKISQKTYEADVLENGKVHITIKEKGGDIVTRILDISGIIGELDLTPPKITELKINYLDGKAIINGKAIESDTEIVGYAFTENNQTPTKWISVSGKKIAPAYTISKAGTYWFWVKNTNDLTDKKSIVVEKIEIAKKYNIEYDANGGEKAPSTQTKMQGEKIKLSNVKPTRVGHIFLGWNLNKNDVSAKYQPGNTYAEDKNLKLYAIWKVKTFDVTYDPNGGTNAPHKQIKKFGQDLVLSNVKPTKLNCTFKGWGITSNATKVNYNPGDTYKSNKAITLYAIWQQEDYVIHYDANGGQDAPVDQKKPQNKIVNLSSKVPSRIGYKFLGWAITSDAVTAQYVSGQEYNTNSDLTLYAVWQEAKYTIRYDANGGNSVPQSQIKLYGEDLIITDKIPKNGNNKFFGWSVDKLALTVDYNPGDKITKNENLTLYAVWTKNTLIASKPNKPFLGTGMKAVYWDDENATNEIEKEVFDESMYSYVLGNGKIDSRTSRWANAKTPDGSYWVWIPRYAYRIKYYTDSSKTNESNVKTKFGNIEVIFLNGTSNNEYMDTKGNIKSLPAGYKVHPAFQKMTTNQDLSLNSLGKWDSELEGIWVAKYEASREDSTDNGVTWFPTKANYGGSDTLTTNAGNNAKTKIRLVSKPSVMSWRRLYIKTMFENARTMYPELNSHQMKNSEWGAVSYLAYSAYGRNGNEVSVNQCMDYYTGAGKGKGASKVSNQAYRYVKKQNNSPKGGNQTFSTQYAWNTSDGRLASTTGNIYGIYDMSGGLEEYTASYVNNGSTSLNTYGDKLVNTKILKYKQAYKATAPNGGDSPHGNYDLNKNIYGDAVFETSVNSSGVASWNDDTSNYPYTILPFFVRGGSGQGNAASGLFNYNYYYGYYFDSYGYRPVICIN